ncbi:MAG: MBL fold metallo-hydrolase [Pseudoflavonifractor sp.]
MRIKQMQVGPIGTNCYLLADDLSHCAIIDPGGNAGTILAELKKSGLLPEMILLTHGHYDHTGGVAELRKALGVPVYLHPADKALLGDQIMPDIGPTRDYKGGDILTLGSLALHVIHTPGHTPGGVTLRAEDALFTGDTLFCGSMGRTDLPGGSYEEIMLSLKCLGRLPGDYRVLPGHEGSSTLEEERKTNYYLVQALGD